MLISSITLSNTIDMSSVSIHVISAVMHSKRAFAMHMRDGGPARPARSNGHPIMTIDIRSEMD